MKGGLKGSQHRTVVTSARFPIDQEHPACEAFLPQRSGARGWLTESPILDPKPGLVPRTGQAPIANCAFGQRRPGMRTFTLIGTQLVTCP